MAGINYQKLVPEGTFIREYMEMMREQETPHSYDFWCALWVLSNVVGRGVVVARPRAHVYLNIYLVLVADSGITRKSTAVSAARDTLWRYYDHVRPEHRRPAPTFVEGRTTPERIEDILAEHTERDADAHIAIAIGELATFMGRAVYSMALPGLLTDLFDCPTDRTYGGTRGTGSRGIRQVYLTLISASTPAWLATAINPDVIEGGFTSRCIFLAEREPKRSVAWAGTDASSTGAVAQLGAVGRALGHDVLHLVPDRHALQCYDEWYQGRDTKGSSFFDNYTATFIGREDTHVLKVAGLLAINAQSPVIKESHIKAAIKVVSHIKGIGAELFQYTAKGQNTRLGLHLLRQYLLEAGDDGRTQAQLTIMMKRYMKAGELQVALQVMNELGAVKKFILHRPNKAGRAPVVWVATDSMKSPTFVSDLLEEMLG